MLVLLVCAWQVCALSLLRAQAPGASGGDDRALEGKQIFSTSCVACHGLDGRGGERGPDISPRPEVQRWPDQALVHIVREGVPGTAMPSFRSLGTARIQAVVRYLGSLQGQTAAVELPGDAMHGKDLFFGKAGCSQCHMVKGEGGFIGSDLSGYAATQSASGIRSAITDPNKSLDPRKRTVIAATMDGKTQTGIARNEDNFSLQLQTIDGAFHLFTKSELQSVEYQPRSLMPDDYGSKLTRQELDDLVSYLMSIGQTSKKPHAEKERKPRPF